MKRQHWMVVGGAAIVVAVLLTLVSYGGAPSANAQTAVGQDTVIAPRADDGGYCLPYNPRTPTPDPRYIGPPLRCIPWPDPCLTPIPRSVAMPGCR